MTLLLASREQQRSQGARAAADGGIPRPDMTRPHLGRVIAELT